jgi:hypothetical protein
MGVAYASDVSLDFWQSAAVRWHRAMVDFLAFSSWGLSPPLHETRKSYHLQHLQRNRHRALIFVRPPTRSISRCNAHGSALLRRRQANARAAIRATCPVSSWETLPPTRRTTIRGHRSNRRQRDPPCAMAPSIAASPGKFLESCLFSKQIRKATNGSAAVHACAKAPGMLHP